MKHKQFGMMLITALLGIGTALTPIYAAEPTSSSENALSSFSQEQAESQPVSESNSQVSSTSSTSSESAITSDSSSSVSSAPSSEAGNPASDLGGTTSSTASLQTVTPPVSDGWVTENGAVYYYKNGEKQKGWLQLDGKQYYLDSETGVRKTSKLFQTEKGFSYAQADGTILSGGKQKGDDGNLYLASSDGILRDPGFLVTPDYDGYWAPYYIDPNTHAVKTGLFSVNGTYYYGREDKGYLACGKYKAPDGKTYLANSDGTLRDSGFLVTPDYDGYWAPYYIDPNTHAVKTGLFSVNGTYYYGREDKDYLACGKYKAPNGQTYLANSDGTLRAPGFLVTPDYDGYWAPYYIDPNTHAVKTGLFSVNGTYYYGREDKGYLACGKYKAQDGKTYLANSDGTLRDPGFLVTPDYDGYWAPYYIDPETHAVKTGLFSVNGTYYYGREDQGYFACGKYKAPNGQTYLANSDGTLRDSGFLVTPDYDGYWAPYYIDPETHAVKTGLFSVNGTYYYGREDQGYFACGKYKAPDGKTYLANSDGTLRNPGFLITPDYDGYWAPYYIDAQTHAVKTGLFSINGTYYYGREDEGYLVCAKYQAPDGTFYLANSDGTLLTQTGWLETSQYDGVTERYYLKNPTGNYSIVKTGKFSVDGYDYYGREDNGSLVVGIYYAPDGTRYYGDQNGILGAIPDTAWINVPYLSQEGNLPTGCELVSAYMVLQYYGVPISEDEWVSRIPCTDLSSIDSWTGLAGPSPDECFVGNPYLPDGFGCFPPVIVNAMNQVLPEGHRAVITTGTSLQELAESYVSVGKPVLVWATINMLPSYPSQTWMITDPGIQSVDYYDYGDSVTGEIFTWPANEHCLVLVGYDSDYYYFNDPYDGNGVKAYDRALVESRFLGLGCRSAVVL
ncbi:C39 family peptidase [Caproicibacterium sp. NSD3]